jgi:hypothetical protein
VELNVLKSFHMKKVVCLLFLVLAAGLSAQVKKGGVITVQGHPHEHLTRLHGHKPAPKPLPRDTGQVIDTSEVKCWVGHVPDTITPEFVDSAYLLVKWTDPSQIEQGDSLLIWGYRWSSISVYVDPKTGERDTSDVTVHTIDMLRAVANADCRFLILLQQTGVNGYTVGGIGYNTDAFSATRPVVYFDTAAYHDATIQFHYHGLPNCNRGQTAVPYAPDSLVKWAIRATYSSPNAGTGIIEHPFNVNYGYPAYDYDYWKLDSDTPPSRWQAGWIDGYWAFFTEENRVLPTAPSFDGVTTRVLTNNSVDGFVFQIPAIWPSNKNFSGDRYGYTCGCNPCGTVTVPQPAKKAKR